MYFNEGKYEMAKEFYNKNIRFLKAKIPDDQENLFRNYSLLAEIYQAEGKYKVANQNLIKSFRFNFQNQNSTNSIITEGTHIIENHLKLSRPDSAAYYLDLLKNQLPENHPFEHKYHQARAKMLMYENRNTEALDELACALQNIKKKWELKKHVEVAMALMEIGDLKVTLGQCKPALKEYDLALDQLQPYNNTERFKILGKKAKALNLLKQEPYISQAIKAVDLSITILDTLKPSFSNMQDKMVLIDDAYPLFESGIQAAFLLYKRTQDRKYLNKAFHYMEKSKSALLLDAVLNVNATAFAKIPSVLLEKEKQLKAEINDAEKKISFLDAENPELLEKLFHLKQDHRNLIDRFETDFPQYYKLRYGTDVIQLEQLQSQLEKNQLLISYFYGKSAIYGLAIAQDHIYFKQISNTASLDHQIKNWVNALGDPGSDLAELQKEGYLLYSKLIKPFLTNKRYDKITIIADGPLNYMPFSALSTDSLGLKYMIDDFSVSYASSATLLDQLKGAGSEKNVILAFAPGFKKTLQADPNKTDLLTPLPNSIRELTAIGKYFPQKLFTEANATVKNFRAYASRASIVHLATHAVVDNNTAEYSFLAFSPQQDEENLLYIKDLYNMQIPAQLVTLSACETGLGELKRGEGFISLSRAFFYSGAKSLVNTLWNINDNSSTAIMGGFYKNLSQGLAKDDALRQAKLTFIHNHREDKLSHPYYWSAFVVSGNIDPIAHNNAMVWIACFVILLLAAIGFIGYRFLGFRES